jgi:hypothetical protein
MALAPWGFGIDRASLEEATVNLCERVMVHAIDPTFPRSKIAIVDQGAGRPQKPRPCITIQISSPIGSPRAGGDVRYWPTKEQWLLQFTDSVDDTYTIAVEGVGYVVVAATLTITELRDAMLVEMAVAHPNWTAVAVGTQSIQIDSTLDGLRLFVGSTPASIVRTRPIKNYFERTFIPALLQVNIQCWGLLSIESPLAVQSGPSIAENMRSAFLNTSMTQTLRECWFAPVTARVLDGADVFNQQTNSDAICQVVMKATSRIDVQVASGTAINTAPDPLLQGA